MPRCRDKYKTTHPSLCEPPPGAPQHPRSRPRSVPRPQYLRLCDGGAAEGDPVLLHPRHQVSVDSRKTLTILTLCAPGRCWGWVWRNATWGQSTLSSSPQLLAVFREPTSQRWCHCVYSLSLTVYILSADCPRSWSSHGDTETMSRVENIKILQDWRCPCPWRIK